MGDLPVSGANDGLEDRSSTAATVPERRRPGRAKGLPRVPGSGRKPGVANHATKSVRDLIIKRGQPVQFLCDVTRGRLIRRGDDDWVLPSLQDRLKAAELLLRRVVPEISAVALDIHSEVEVSGKPDTSREDQIELARTVAFMLRKGAMARAELEEAKIQQVETAT